MRIDGEIHTDSPAGYCSLNDKLLSTSRALLHTIVHRWRNRFCHAYQGFIRYPVGWSSFDAVFFFLFFADLAVAAVFYFVIPSVRCANMC